MTFSELKTNLSNWLHRSDLTSIIPTLITLAEVRINRDVNHFNSETTVEDTTTGEITLPNDFILIKDISVNISGSQCVMKYHYRPLNDDSGNPLYYYFENNKIKLYPTPDNDLTYRLRYKATVPALSDSNTTNWLSLLSPDIYIYASLLEASPYIKDDDRIPVWVAAYKSAVESLNHQSWNAKLSNMNIRAG